VAIEDAAHLRSLLGAEIEALNRPRDSLPAMSATFGSRRSRDAER
jgi:hypothetical protein